MPTALLVFEQLIKTEIEPDIALYTIRAVSEVGIYHELGKEGERSGRDTPLQIPVDLPSAARPALEKVIAAPADLEIAAGIVVLGHDRAHTEMVIVFKRGGSCHRQEAGLCFQVNVGG